MRLTKANIESLIGKKVTFTVEGYEANGLYNGTAIIKSVDFGKRHPIECEVVSGDNLGYAFIDSFDSESFAYSDSGRPIEVYLTLEDRLSTIGNGCRIELEESIPDNEGRLVLFCADGNIHSAAYIYNDDTLYRLRDWQSSRPESPEEIADFEWLTEDGKNAIVMDGKPRRIL